MKHLSIICILFFFLIGCDSSSDAWVTEAKTRLKKNEIISAKDAIEKALQKNPGSAEAYNLKGVIDFQEKNYKEAEINYEKAVEIKPSFYEAQLNLAAVRMETLQWKKALIPVQNAIKIAPDSSNGFLQRGIIWAALSKVALAKKDFQTAIQKNPKEINAIYNLGNILYQSSE